MSQPPPFTYPTPIIPRPIGNHDSIESNSTAMGTDSSPDYLKLILNARVYDVAVETPLQFAKTISAKTGSKIYLKREDMQPVFSFKCRGAYNRMYRLTPEEKARGVIAVSAGIIIK